MADTYLYLSLIPEALVASMLPPEEFGTYLAVGTMKRSRGDAMYFSLKSDFRSDFFDFARVARSCVPHADGSPKHSVYAGTYRVLEHVPLDALEDLYLTTRDGRVLKLEQAPLPSDFPETHFVYDEICPVHPLIASRLNPVEFSAFITDPETAIRVPRICFVQLDAEFFIGASQDGSVSHPLGYLPDRMHDCFAELDRTDKRSKTVDRTHQLACGWKHVKNGYFVGDPGGVVYYPFPSPEELARHHHKWHRSAML